MATSVGLTTRAFGQLRLSASVQQHGGSRPVRSVAGMRESSSLFGQSLCVSRPRAAPVVRLAGLGARAATGPVKKKADSAEKRARQAEKRRVQNKAKKSELATRMKKALLAIAALKSKGAAATKEELVTVEALIGEAYSVIDKAVKTDTIHKNKGAHRKSRLARAKRATEIALGWYTPAPVAAVAA